MNAEIDFLLPDGRRWTHRFESPIAIHEALTLADVLPCLTAARRAAEEGHWVVGFVGYEASPAFDPHAEVSDHRLGPLALFAVFARSQPVADTVLPGPFEVSHWDSATSRERFNDAMSKIHEDIRNGVYYQANYSRRLSAEFAGDGLGFFRALHHTQPGAFSVYLDWERGQIASVSPELFFHWQPETRHLATRPMKGTAARAADPARDQRVAEDLQNNPKERAENLMIVDLLRNDLGRLAEPGSVRVSKLFQMEALPTVWQMTSTIEARAREATRLEDIFTALFPCGSVTGAPKGTAMAAIRAYEDGPRGIYCGALGAIAPGGEAVFNVAIRSVQIDRTTGRAICGIGSGITWSSLPEGEWLEWQAKRRFLWKATAGFEVLETLRCDQGGWVLLEQHLDRMALAARYFGFPFDRSKVSLELKERALQHPTGIYRVRLTLNRHGDFLTEWHVMTGPMGSDSLLASMPTASVSLAREAFVEDVDFIQYKTTHRPNYARFTPAGEDLDTLLWNVEGELTEFTRGNLAIFIDGEWRTPSLRSGLLPGIRRQVLIERGELKEGVILKQDLERAEAVVFINSLRGCIPVRVRG